MSGAHLSAGKMSVAPAPVVAGAGARAAWATLALAAFAALGVFAWTHPWGAFAGTGIVCAALALMSWRRDAWLLVVPGLLPVADLAGWTGAIHFTESDALVLSALAVGGLAEAWRPSVRPRGGVWRFGAVQCGLAGLMGLSYAVSTAWAPLPAVATDPGLLAGYLTPLNGPRLAKGFFWALLLLPLLGVALRARPAQAARYGVAGVLLGLLLVSLAGLWERIAFTDLTDFASDYRTTALFWEMNVGGATLDGWLALTFPFALWAALRVRGPALAAVLVVLALAAYAAFTTFSRGLYLGLAAGCGLAIVLMSRSAARQSGEKVALPRLAAWSAFALVFGWSLTGVFQAGGYRGLAAMLGVACAVFACGPVVAVSNRKALALALALGAAGIGLSTLAAWWVPKGVYFAYGLGAGCLALLLLAPPAGRSFADVGMLAVACLVWLAGTAVLVTVHWAEGAGLAPAALAAAIAVLPLGVVRMRPAYCWRPGVDAWVRAGLVLGSLAMVVISFNSYYAEKRFETVAQDLSGRLQHWSWSAALPAEGGERWLGVGTGQFAERYFWRVPDGMYPGSHRIEDDDGDRYLRLGGPRHVLGFGELYRVSQRVSGDLQPPLLLALRARAPGGDAGLHLEICRKHLLYANECTIKAVRVPGDGAWHRVEAVLPKEGLGGGGRWLPRLTTFSIAGASAGRQLEIDDLSLIDARGQSLLRNGDFSAASDFWFFSSDRHHLPWHAKSLWLHYYVEQGVLGALAFTLLCVAAFHRVTLGRAAAHALAPPVAGALAGFMVVGAFDSLVDAPRLATLAFLLIFLALGLRPPRLSAAVA